MNSGERVINRPKIMRGGAELCDEPSLGGGTISCLSDWSGSLRSGSSFRRKATHSISHFNKSDDENRRMAIQFIVWCGTARAWVRPDLAQVPNFLRSLRRAALALHLGFTMVDDTKPSAAPPADL